MIACVWVGDKYGAEYVEKLRNMVRRFTDEAIYCLTDKKTQIDGVNMVLLDSPLPKWWSKMYLFNTEWRHEHCTYFDLDTVILRDPKELLDYRGDFAICENFTRLAGNTAWPCRYGSCVMSIPKGFGQDIFNKFWSSRFELMERFLKWGDQRAIEYLYPDAVLLQDVMPKGYFLGYRDFTKQKPESPICIFAGTNKPDNSRFEWVKEAWT